MGEKEGNVDRLTQSKKKHYGWACSMSDKNERAIIAKMIISDIRVNASFCPTYFLSIANYIKNAVVLLKAI